MITEICFIRHGESETNSENRFTGRYNAKLTEKGKVQAEICGKYLQNAGFDIVFTSPLIRAKVSAEIIADKKVKIVVDKRLSELDGGLWNGEYYKKIAEMFPKSFYVFKNDIDNFKADGGESVSDVRERIIDFISFVLNRYNGKKICVVTHAIVIRALFSFYMNKRVMEIPFPTNGSVSVLKFTDNAFFDIEYGSDNHMGMLKTNINV